MIFHWQVASKSRTRLSKGWDINSSLAHLQPVAVPLRDSNKLCLQVIYKINIQHIYPSYNKCKEMSPQYATVKWCTENQNNCLGKWRFMFYELSIWMYLIRYPRCPPSCTPPAVEMLEPDCDCSCSNAAFSCRRSCRQSLSLDRIHIEA